MFFLRKGMHLDPYILVYCTLSSIFAVQLLPDFVALKGMLSRQKQPFRVK